MVRRGCFWEDERDESEREWERLRRSVGEGLSLKIEEEDEENVSKSASRQSWRLRQDVCRSPLLPLCFYACEYACYAPFWAMFMFYALFKHFP